MLHRVTIKRAADDALVELRDKGRITDELMHKLERGVGFGGVADTGVRVRFGRELGWVRASMGSTGGLLGSWVECDFL